MNNIKISGTTFYEHLQNIYNIFGSNPPSISGADAILILRGKHEESNKDTFQPNISLLHNYILGYDFTESMIVFTPKTIIALVGPKKKLLLEQIERPQGIICPDLKIYLRNTQVGSNKERLKEIIDQIFSDCNKQKIKLGIVKSELGLGNTRDEWDQIYQENASRIQYVDIPYFIPHILAKKDKGDIEKINISSKFSCFVLEYLNKKFEDIIENEKTATHESISKEISDLTKKQKFLKRFSEKIMDKYKQKIDSTLLELNSNPIIQSGGHYNLEPICDCDENNLSSDIIICKVNSKYNEYSSNVIRTFMIDVDKDMQTKYKILYEAFNLLLSSLEEGVKISDVYKKVKNEILQNDSSLTDSIPLSFGNEIGLSENSNYYEITETNDKIIENGMCFNIILSLSNLTKSDDSEKKFSLQLGDTVLVRKNPKTNSNIINMTGALSKVLTDIFYNMDEEKNDDNMKNDNQNKKDNESDSNPFQRKTRHKDHINDDRFANLERRNIHQEELLQKKNNDFRDKMENHPERLTTQVEESKIDLSKIKSYDSKSQFPPDLKNGQIYFDSKNYTVFLPIYNQMVPFHISLFKNASKSEDNNLTVLRINFLIPSSGINFGKIEGNNNIFIRDISYKHKDAKVVANVLNKIKEMQKNYKQKQLENKEKTDLIAQDNLILNKGKRIALNDVTLRPNISGKKTVGNLEAHTNGLRFISNKGEKIEIIYKNVKHAFLQPCENELIVLVHFHLKNPILIGRKKAQDIQFYKEAGVQADDLDNRRRGNDYEEYEYELKERQLRERMNEEFEKFAKNIESLYSLEFDIPFREMQFTGVPFRSNVNLIPTKYCLVSLIEMPVFVITISEVDIVYFERVSNSTKNFDMNFIFKDLSKPVLRITTIPMESLDMIKTWLDENDILFGEGQYNIFWPKIIENIIKDPEAFLEDGGWKFILNDDSDDEKESVNDGDSNYNPDSEEEDEQEDDDEEYKDDEDEEDEESDYIDDDDEDVSDNDDELSEKGVSWEEMEKKAAMEDKESARRHREENNERKKGKKHGKY